MVGGFGDDILRGGTGSDRIFGYGDSDTLIGYGGGSGEFDTLVGDEEDVSHPRDGADTFVLGDKRLGVFYYLRGGVRRLKTLAIVMAIRYSYTAE